MLSLTVDGKQKEFDGSTTYANIKILLKNIQKSAYFEKINQAQPQPLQCQQPSETPELSESLATWDMFSQPNFLVLIVLFSRTETDDASDDNSLDEKMDTEPTTATTIPEENAVNATNVSTEPASTEQVSEDTGAVEYQEAPSASAVPVPTFTPQQPLAAAPSPGIAAPPQNLKTLPHGMYTFWYASHFAHDFYPTFFANWWRETSAEKFCIQSIRLQERVVQKACSIWVNCDSKIILIRIRIAPASAGGVTIPMPQVPQNHQIRAGHVQPTTVRAVESAYFKQHQYVQQMARPLAEVLGQGNFFFLQESELDSPEVPNNNPTSERQPVCQIGVSFTQFFFWIFSLQFLQKQHEETIWKYEV